MRNHKIVAMGGLAAAVFSVSKTAWAAAVFVDDFSAGNTYTALAPSGNYIASDESSVGT